MGATASSAQVSTPIAKLPPRTQNVIFTDKVIAVGTKKVMFRMYDSDNCWYKIIDGIELRSQISKAIRDTRKRMSIKPIRRQVTRRNQQRHSQRSTNSNTNMHDENSNFNENNYTCQGDYSLMGLDPRNVKRFKMDDSNCCGKTF